MSFFGTIVKTEIYLAVCIIIFLVIVILSGVILYEINKSGCKDSHIVEAHKWAAWAVGLSSVGAGLAIIAFIAIIFLI